MNFNLAKLVESHGVESCEKIIRKKIQEDKIEHLSIRHIYESFCPNIPLQSRQNSNFISPDTHLQEAEVRLSAFTNITGELISKKVIAGYKSVSGIGEHLTTKYPSKLRDERIPGFSSHDNVKEVTEGDAYEEAGFHDKYVTTGDPKKKGRIISITEEAVHYDQTGLLLQRAFLLGERAALDKEKTILKTVLGIDDRYYPSGVETAIYAAAPYKITSNALVDWTDIEKAELDGFGEMLDDMGEKIIVLPKAILVPSALKRTALRILHATEIIHGDYDDAASIKTKSLNPVKNEYKVLSSPLIHSLQITAGTDAGIAKSNWWFGEFGRQFWWKEVFPIQTFKAQNNNIQQFERDIVSRYKVRFFGNCFVVDQRYVIKNLA